MSLCTLAFIFSGIALATPIPNARMLVARQFTSTDLYKDWPTYDELPLHPSFPTKAAWGVWGADDELGALNHITPSTIAAAKEEIQQGIAINLNLRLDIPNPPLVNTRPQLVHAFVAEEGYNDDVITINTQLSTQIDGLRHFPYSLNGSTSTYQFYNELVTFQDIMSAEGITTLGIHNIAQKGLAGRGVLLDWAAWMDSRNAPYNPFLEEKITASDLDAVAEWQGLPENFTRPGDFLIVRTGFTQRYRTLSEYDQNILPYRVGANATFSGVEASDETLRWLWEKKVAVVGSDNLAFESAPTGSGSVNIDGRSLHQIFIGGWGQSIVELLDLEQLSETCRRLGRFTFFFTMQSLNVHGGIASPPNAMALM